MKLLLIIILLINNGMVVKINKIFLLNKILIGLPIEKMHIF